MVSIQRDLDQQLRTGANKINQLAERLTSLNVQIAQVELTGQRANDLRDQRDTILDELSRLAHVSYYETSQGAINVYLGGRSLVAGSVSEKVTISTDSADFATLVWDSDLSPVSINDGELFGLQQARDIELPVFMGDLQALSQQLMSSVNAVHRTGYGLDNSTDNEFFVGSGANDIAVNPILRANPVGIAAAGASSSPGDNSVALAIIGLQSALTMNGGTADFGRFLSSTVSRLGVDLQQAEMLAENQQVLVDHITRQKEASSGVSLDEETTRLIEYQRAYEAAARVVNVVDEKLDLLINGTGRVGR
jgi:flagellar hook-associated protein 1 FlgK